MNSDYQDALRYLYSFINYEALPGASPVKMNLEKIEVMVHALDHPERQWPSIHVAGTKGKGSTSAIIASIVRQGGYCVGLYTSPHLVSFRERIVVDGEMISKADICRLVDIVRPVVETVARRPSGPPNFFEVWTALAFLYFAERRVDVAVVEAGLGGRLDATNVITPLTAVITPVGLDHTDRLGTTLEAIAREKAGIVKEGIPTVIGPQESDALSVIRDTCRIRRSPLWSVGSDIRYKIRHADTKGQVFDVEGRQGRYPDLKTSLLGAYQVANAATAIGAVETLDRSGLTITPRHIVDGLRAVESPGRLQILQTRPWLILDGAHNVLAARTLAQTVRTLFPYRRAILVVSLHQDKDVTGMCKEFSTFADDVIVTERRIMRQRQADPETVADVFRASEKTVTIAPSVSSALELAGSLAKPDDLICVTGCFVLVGEAMEVLQHLEPEELLSR